MNGHQTIEILRQTHLRYLVRLAYTSYVVAAFEWEQAAKDYQDQLEAEHNDKVRMYEVYDLQTNERLV